MQAVQAVQAVPAVQAPEPVAQHKAAPCQGLHSSLLTGTVPPPLSERRTAPSIPSIPSIPGIPGIPGIVSPPPVSPPALSQTTVGTPMTPPQPSGFPLASTTPMTPMTLGPLGHPPSLAGAVLILRDRMTLTHYDTEWRKSLSQSERNRQFNTKKTISEYFKDGPIWACVDI